MTVREFRRRHTTVQAIQWTGDNAEAVRAFTDEMFTDQPPATPDPDHPGDTAQVYDRLHGVWVPLGVGDWVLRGVRGEHWPVRADVFVETYEPAEEATR